jgi:putative transposase
MGHTHSRLLYHIIWGTRNREPWLGPNIQTELYAYLARLLEKNGAFVYKIDGMEDHVHCVCQLRTSPSVAKVVKDAKSYSTGWIKRRFGLSRFAWQEGYGPFTVSASQLQSVIDYVRNQKEHHRTKSFEEEYIDFLRKHGLEIDPESLFD